MSESTQATGSPSTGKMHFSASVKMAIAFVLSKLLNPRSAWPDVNWCHFKWFDDITTSDVEVLGPEDRDPLHEKIRRVVRFYLRDDLVAEITMEGLRLIEPYEGKRMPSWAVAKVSYETDWQTERPSTRVELELGAAWLTGPYAEE